MSPYSPRARSTLRWGGAIAALLVVQSLFLAGVFWLLATESHVREAESGFRDDCRAFAKMKKGERMEELREEIDRDIHRDRYLALFDIDGSLLKGNVARLPPGPIPDASGFATIRPTELPGRTSDEVRYAVCVFADGTRLLTGVDLRDSQYAIRVVERAVLLGLIPGLALAIGFGLIAGRRAARQVDAVRSLTQRIMAGDLRGRLSVADPPDSFGVLCLDINQMLDRLERLVGDVRGVGDDIAHQLRTPLTRLRARVERAMAQAADRGAFQDASDEALVDIDRILGIVAALLRIRELEDNERRSRFRDLELARIGYDACDLHRPDAEDQGVTLLCRLDSAATVRGDASLLIEAFSNLIDNAIKFGPAGGTVTLSVVNEDGVPIVTVADDGAGIPPAERRLVTQRFYRGRRDRDGTGLGLSLVHAITELHGFTLRFDNRRSAVSVVCDRPRSV